MGENHQHKIIPIAKFFEKGLHFSCQMCGDCCRGLGEGEVYLYAEDIKCLAEHLGYSLDEEGLRTFAEKYLKIADDVFYWKDPKRRGRKKKFLIKTLAFRFTGEDAHCEFLSEDNACTVHEARPFQCRSFPFWQMMVSSEKNLRDYAKKCPGLKKTLKGEGKFYKKEEIVEWALKEQKVELEYFLKLKAHNFDIFQVYPFLAHSKYFC